MGAKLPAKQAAAYAIAAALASSYEIANHLDARAKYITRLPREVAEFGFRALATRDENVFADPSYLEWRAAAQ